MLIIVLLLDASLALFGAGMGAGVITLVAAFDIEIIGAAAMKVIDWQPEAGNKIQTAMIIAAALIEGFVLFGVFICRLIATK